MTNQLTALNIMLAAIGETEVSDFDSTIPEATKARLVLANISREVQSHGLHCNTDKEVTYTPDPVTKKIAVGADVLSIDASYSYIDAVQRGAFLYNREKHTYEWDEPVLCDVVALLDFDDLPEAHRYYIAVRSARIFQHQIMGSETLEQFTQDDEGRARAMMLGVEMKASDHRMTSFPPVLNIVGRW